MGELGEGFRLTKSLPGLQLRLTARLSAALMTESNRQCIFFLRQSIRKKS